jgi:hypothetical protein
VLDSPNEPRKGEKAVPGSLVPVVPIGSWWFPMVPNGS